MRPPHRSTVSFAMDKPSPVPLWAAVSGFLLVKKRSKSCSRSSGEMPGPESLMQTCSASRSFNSVEAYVIVTRECWGEHFMAVVQHVHAREPHKAAIRDNLSSRMSSLIFFDQKFTFVNNHLEKT